MKTWFLFGYKPWAKSARPVVHETTWLRWKPLAFGLWYLSSSRCPVTGAWM
jgi:hypothetical protein